MITSGWITQLFCHVDDFCQQFEPEWEKILIPPKGGRKKVRSLSLAEVITIITLFHFSGYRTFKHYYQRQVLIYWKAYFPGLPSYSWFVRMAQSAVFPMFVYLHANLGKPTGMGYIDSTVLTVCHIARASSHKVFKKMARKGKTTTGWFFGFKLHVVINHKAEITGFMLTSGNTDDRRPVRELTKELFGQLFADRGYVGKQLFRDLFERGLQLIAKSRKNMKLCLINLVDKALLRQRSLIESVFNRLKMVFQIEHHRHRSGWNFLTNLFGGLIAYCIDPRKPSFNPKSSSLLGSVA